MTPIISCTCSNIPFLYSCAMSKNGTLHKMRIYMQKGYYKRIVKKVGQFKYNAKYVECTKIPHTLTQKPKSHKKEETEHYRNWKLY